MSHAFASSTPAYATDDPASSSIVLLDKGNDREPDADVISLSESTESDTTEIADFADLEVDADTVIASLDTLLSLQHGVVAGLRKLHHGGDGNAEKEVRGDEGVEDEIIATAARNAETLLLKSQELSSAVRKHVINGRVELRMAVIYDYTKTPQKKKRQEEGGNHVDLGAPVLKWASDAVITLLDVQADLDQCLGAQESAAVAQAQGKTDVEDDKSETESWADSMVFDDEPELVVTLHRHLEPLARLGERAQDLLAVIDDVTGSRQKLTSAPNPVTSGANYCWRGPVLNTAKDEAAITHTKAQAYPNAQPETPYTLLRRELYAIKDELKSKKSYFSYSRPDWSLNNLSTEMRKCQALIGKAYTIIEELLSNNGEDWLASAKTGGMTFENFQSLNTDQVKALRRRLEAVRFKLMSCLIQQPASDFNAVSEVTAELLVFLGSKDCTPDRRAKAREVDEERSEETAASDKMAERLVVLGDW